MIVTGVVERIELETPGKLHAHDKTYGFHVRLKRVFEVRSCASPAPTSGQRTSAHVIAKSVGWGWLGYHAYIAGTRLSGLVPRVIGLRHGLLFSEWVSDISADGASSVPHLPIQTLSSYVGTRARLLRLAEDPFFEDLGYGRTAWSELVNLLRRAYGLYIGRFKIPALHRRLRKLVSPMPALIDGCVKPDEWVTRGREAVKVDFEHHSFGKTELNVVDPAYDLAYATLAFGLSPEQERQLVERYAHESGDGAAADRMLLYKLLHGVIVMEDALRKTCCDPSESRHEWNGRYLAARRWLTSQLARFAASRIPSPAAVRWSKRLFFLDLDGVFDSETFGFPHPTTSGLAALDLLRAHGFAVVLNTGRNVADIHAYCRDYHLPGGLGELGSVFVDAVAQREIPLIDGEGAEQLARCRDAFGRLPGVFVDPAYRYAVRVCRYEDERAVPPPRAQVEEVLRQAGLDRLAVSPSSVDAIIVQRGVDKGRGLTIVREYLECADQPVAAIGDSDRDIPMLTAADSAFAPSGCSPAIHALGHLGRCRVIAAPMQRGLLCAARELAGLRPETGDRAAGAAAQPTPAADLLASLLRVVERSRLRQVVGALTWWRL